MLDVILFVISCSMFVLLGVINWFFVKNKKDYFYTKARNISIFGNAEYKDLFNKILIRDNGYKFGTVGETISSVLGKNTLTKTLTRTGRCIVWILSKEHCIDAINNDLKS